MPLAALLLVLGAAVCHSAWNLLVKTDARRLQIQSGALVVGVVLCSPALLIHPLTEVSRSAWAAILLSGVFETAYVFALTAAYGAGDLSLVYPVARGTPPLLVVPLAVVLLGERPSAQGLAGIGLVVVGICARRAGGRGGRPGRARRAHPARAPFGGPDHGRRGDRRGPRRHRAGALTAPATRSKTPAIVPHVIPADSLLSA